MLTHKFFMEESKKILKSKEISGHFFYFMSILQSFSL